ncbi:hypothetical protein Kpol_1037p56 [Vanderwaltozyma polyspora DSM 70294]|uniref:Kinase n=1 Tax=Vanderwaltozyma polyspora (strain ATCC 22028 / DSM 70294 / BCRC 21397 / CBS 2163 / NBRC 10782 / NRRL Y-8283 / UCD 57-17) TaxID=436907 RepID=A7TJZ7_VANPO|nr:uncharacterized protein Kpol_1037p56 [Vanderwaltozyma polyspora DSM 70294]EDO17459.1 hypothetical protein Kpol_1037p56 [Vanderwaltozyma polyspora DSM 70294]
MIDISKDSNNDNIRNTPSDTVQHLKSNESITHLSDPFSESKVMLNPSSTILRGRKASAYLRIFRDDVNQQSRDSSLNNSETDDSEPYLDDGDIIRKNSDLQPIDEKVRLSNNATVSTSSTTTTGAKKTTCNSTINATVERSGDKIIDSRKSQDSLNNINLPKSVQYLNIDSSLALDKSNLSEFKKNGNHDRDTIRITQEGIGSDYDGLKQTSEGLSLTPISSATYYPHKSVDHENDISIDDTDFIDNQAGIIDSKTHDNDLITPIKQENLLDTKNNNNSKKQTIVDKKIESSTGEIKQTSDQIKKDTKIEPPTEKTGQYEDEEDEEDEEENGDNIYPLAVELQPFTNNVGGHTAIFRFSKRAVCKALVNRENKWYETIELKHKELLKFMPRYIGVLNVRQHFRSKEDFLRELSNNKKMKKEHKYKQLQFVNDGKYNDEYKSEPLKHVKSYPEEIPQLADTAEIPRKPSIMKTHSHILSVDDNDLTRIGSKSYDHSPIIKEDIKQQHLLPEVVLNDNKHIIPDSLWGQYSDSPLNSQRDFCLHGGIYPPPTETNTYESKYNCDSGSTMVNTKLQELVLQEVFAPTHQRRQRMNSADLKNTNSGISLSNDAIRNLADRGPTDNGQQGKDRSASPLLHKAIQESLSNAVDSSSSMMDLKQFHRKEIAKEKSRKYSLSDISTPLHASGKSKSDFNEDNQLIMSPLSLTGPGNDDVIIDGDNVISHNSSNFYHRNSSNSINSPTSNNNESITFEEHSDTIVSKFILLEDLTRKLVKPCALDLKMGTRQYGVDATKTKQLSQRKKCLNTTSRKLGSRICGLKVWDQSYYICRDKYFGRRVKIGWQFTRVLARFFYNGKNISSILLQIPNLIARLEKLSAELHKLKGYRLYGASLLLMYDGGVKKPKAKLYLIDFARSVTKDDLDGGIENFRMPPKTPNNEDRGFIRGLRSLKFYLTQIWSYLTKGEAMISNEEALEQYLFVDNKDQFEKPWDWLDEFDKEKEVEYNDPKSELRKKWRKYELIFDVEPRYTDEDGISD